MFFMMMDRDDWSRQRVYGQKTKLTRKIVPVFVKPCQVAGLNMSNAPRSEEDFIFPIKDTFLRIRKGNKCLYNFRAAQPASGAHPIVFCLRQASRHLTSIWRYETTSTCAGPSKASCEDAEVPTSYSRDYWVLQSETLSIIGASTTNARSSWVGSRCSAVSRPAGMVAQQGFPESP